MKILAVQNRMGIGDTVIFLPFIEAISKKFDTPVDILVRESSKANQFLNETNYIGKIIVLDRDKNSSGRHNGFFGTLGLISEIKKYNFDKIFIFNSSLRYYLIAKLSKTKEIFQYPLFKKKNQHIIKTAKQFIKEKINLEINTDAKIFIHKDKINNAIKEFQIDKDNLNILLGIGGSGPTKRVPAKTFLKLIEILLEKTKRKFYLATGKKNEEQIILKEIMSSKYKRLCVPLDSLSINQTLPIIKNCNIAICNDTSFSHLAAALGVETITLMADTPLMYGSYNSKMHPVIPDGESTVSHHTTGKDKINPYKIYNQLIKILD